MARLVNAMLFLLLLLAGAVTLAWRLAHGDESLPAGGWRDGAVTAAIDARVTRSMTVDSTLDGWLHGLLYAVTGDTGPQVRQGCPGWLFLEEETASTPQGDAHLRARVRLAALLRSKLQQRGVALVSVPVPDKVEQARAQLCGLAVSYQAQGRRAAWQRATPDSSTQVDLHRGWPAPAYWRLDTHWNRAGAAWAAGKVGAKVLAVIPAGSLAMHYGAATNQRRSGDLARLAGLDRTDPPFAPSPEYDRIATLDIEHTGGLLDDVAAPQVLLAGSSYSLNSGFIDALQLALGQEVRQQSQAGGGFAGSLLALLARPRRLDGVKVVVWEWPLRVLYQPLTAAERAYLAQAD
jgi:alginate O-acetyltransferase complex protein AlgJ